MDCSEAKTHLSAFASGLTNDLDRTEIEAHLQVCEECSLEVELLRGRASGKATPPPNSDWTIEKIFGDGGGAEDGPPATASAPPSSFPTAEPMPAPDAPSDVMPEPAPVEMQATAPPPPTPSEKPSMILPPLEAAAVPPPPRTAKGKKANAESWGFEPADASREAAPPEESVVLAEKALTRDKIGGSSAKDAASRALLWGVGGIAGVGLLAASIWLTLAVRQAPPREISTGAARSHDAAPMPDETTPASTDSTVADAPKTAMAPDVSDVRPLQARTLAPGSSGTPDVTTAAPSPSPTPSNPAAPKSGAGPKKGTNASVATTAAPTPATSRVTTPTTTARATSPVVAPTRQSKRDDDEMWPTDETVHFPSTSGTVSTVKPPARVGSATRPPADSPTSVKVVPPPDASEDVAPAAPVSPDTPIGRLHLATEKATKDRDMVALRQLKTAWKSLVRTVVGPDRSRAKREYADCLWSIQEISGRDADQRETLDAYRDYLLNAPAGGADARSAERLRELEDALRERR